MERIGACAGRWGGTGQCCPTTAVTILHGGPVPPDQACIGATTGDIGSHDKRLGDPNARRAHIAAVFVAGYTARAITGSANGGVCGLGGGRQKGKKPCDKKPTDQHYNAHKAPPQQRQTVTSLTGGLAQVLGGMIAEDTPVQAAWRSPQRVSQDLS